MNNTDKVVGSARLSGTEDFVGFLYDIRKDKFTELDGMTAAFGISNPGVIVGTSGDQCVVRDKKGNLTTLTPPGDPMDPAVDCNARGINASGEIAGFETRDSGFQGFKYHPNSDDYETFLQSPGTSIAHGINAHGQTIGGTTFLNDDEVFPGSPAGVYGFIRDADGTENFFRVDGEDTRGRGLSENGKMAGWFIDVFPPPNDFAFSFVAWTADAPTVPGFEDITLTADQILDPGPCNPDFEPPSEDYTLYTDVIAQAIRNDGVIAGSCGDFYVLFLTPGDPSTPIIGAVFVETVGFIAVPE